MKKHSVKVLSLVLALIMMLSLCPLEAFAAGNQWGWGNWWDQAEGPEMPAQQLKATDSATGVSITVDAPEGALPKGTELSVKAVNLSAVQNIVDNDAEASGTVVAAEDITFYYEGVEIEPEKSVSVALASDAISNTLNPTVLHLDCSAEEIESGNVPVEVMGSGTSFSSKDFSVYAVINGESTDEVSQVEVYFYVRKDSASGPSSDASKWTLINKQIVRADQLKDCDPENNDFAIHDPGVPTMTKNQSFEGWTQNKNFAVGERGRTVQRINQLAKAAAESGDLPGEVKYYAMVYDVVYITYHDQAGAVLETESNHVNFAANGSATLSKTFDRPYTPFKGGQKFFGWIPASYVTSAGDYPVYTSGASSHYYVSDGTTATTLNYASGSNNLDVYPYLAEGYWLIFDNNIAKNNTANGFDDSTSASYTAPDLYLSTENTTAPTAPTRTGYDFGGWYTDAAMTTAFTFGSNLTADTTVYAKWTPKQTTYYVIFWQQSANDAVDAADADKTYDFYKSVERTATTGTSVSINTSDRGTTADNRLGGNSTNSIGEMGYYFTYNATNTDTGSVVVNGDGSTVLNVYYDRRTITINFHGSLSSVTYDTRYTSGNSYSYWWNNNYAHYGLVSGKYVLLELGSNDSQYPDDDGEVPARSGYPKWTVVSTGADYTGTIYEFSGTSTSSSNTAITLEGLYDAPLAGWPQPGVGYQWHSTSGSYTGNYGMTLPVYSYKIWATDPTSTAYHDDTWNIWRETYSPSNPKSIIYLGEDTDGNYTINLADYELGYDHNLTIDHTLFYGYSMYSYQYGTASNANAGTETSLVNAINYTCRNGDDNDTFGSYTQITFKYARNKWNFVYTSNNHDVKTESVFFQKSLSDLSSYVPTNGPEGYYFDGWYADPGFDTPFDFTQTMPNHAVHIYAKWTLIRFRCVLDYGTSDDIVFPGNQADSFRLDYGEQVQDSAIQAATREGYTLLGWYYRENGTGAEKEFNFAMGANESMADMNYGTQQAGESDEAFAARMNGDTRKGSYRVVPNTTGDTEWTDQYNSSTDPRKTTQVRGKIVIYAKWRQDPEGVIGVHVRYLSDNPTDTGYFPNSEDANDTSNRVWNDPNIYVDLAQAYAQPASTPDTLYNTDGSVSETQNQFLYWEILDKDGNPTGRRAYPGQTWEVHLEDATTPADCDHTGSRTHHAANAATCTAAGNSEYWQCDNCGKKFDAETGGNVIDPTIAALGHNVEGVEWSHDGTNHWHICTRCHEIVDTAAHTMVQTAYTAPANGNPGSRTETCTVCGYSVTTVVNGYVVHFSVPADVTAPADQTVEPGNNADLTVTPTGTIEGYTFLGWVEAAVAETTTVVNPLASYTPTGDATLYALYSHTANGDTVYELLTQAPSDWTGNYVITGSQDSADITKYFMKGIAGGSSYENSSNGGQVLLANTGIVYDSTNNRLSNVDPVYVFSVASYGTGYSIRNTSTSSYLDSESSGTLYAASSLSSACRWTLSFSSPNVVAQNTTNSTYQYLAFLNSSSDSSVKFFGLYKSAVTSIYFWAEKQLSTTYYTTVTGEGGNAVTEPVAEIATIPAEAAAPAAVAPVTPEPVRVDTSDDYTITLRAVYGLVNKDASTHIYWYANDGTSAHDGAGARYVSQGAGTAFEGNTSKLEINEWVTIPAPAGHNDSLIDFVGDVAGKTQLVYEDHVFLGWARVPTTGSGAEGTAHPELGEDDLYLKWTGSGFLAKNKAGTWVSAEKVYADEAQPYHDMYAVWAKVFYVYHSGTGKVERIVIDNPRYETKADGTNEPISNTFDLTSLVSDGFLYGGYYKDYAGKGTMTVKDENEQDVTIAFDAKQVANWTPVTDKATILTDVRLVDSAASNADLDKLVTSGRISQAIDPADDPNKPDDNGAILYNYDNLSKDLEKMVEDGEMTAEAAEAFEARLTWDYWKDSYNADTTDEDGNAKAADRPGNAIIPEAGKTYYIKEVPASMYLLHYTHYTYKIGDTDGVENKIMKMWMISDIDDVNYQGAGFVYFDENHKAQVVTTLTIRTTGSTPKDPDELSAVSLFGENSEFGRDKGVTRGYLTYSAITGEELAGKTQIANIQNFWITPDNMMVTGEKTRTLDDITSAKTIKSGTLDAGNAFIAPYVPGN